MIDPSVDSLVRRVEQQAEVIKTLRLAQLEQGSMLSELTGKDTVNEEEVQQVWQRHEASLRSSLTEELKVGVDMEKLADLTKDRICLEWTDEYLQSHVTAPSCIDAVTEKVEAALINADQPPFINEEQLLETVQTSTATAMLSTLGTVAIQQKRT